MKKLIVGLIIGLMSMSLMAADVNDYNTLEKQRKAIRVSKNYVALEQIGSEMMALDVAKTNIDIMRQGANNKLAGMYCRDRNAARVEYPKLEKLFTGVTLARFILRASSWWGIGAIIPVDQTVLKIAPHIAAIRKGDIEYKDLAVVGMLQYYGDALIKNNSPKSEVDAVVNDMLPLCVTDDNYRRLVSLAIRNKDVSKIRPVLEKLNTIAGYNGMIRIAAFQNDTVALNTAGMNLIFAGNRTMTEARLLKIFDGINPGMLSVADYTAFLENTIKSTRATEDYAKFLGRLKSELEKMK